MFEDLGIEIPDWVSKIQFKSRDQIMEQMNDDLDSVVKFFSSKPETLIFTLQDQELQKVFGSEIRVAHREDRLHLIPQKGGEKAALVGYVPQDPDKWFGSTDLHGDNPDLDKVSPFITDENATQLSALFGHSGRDYRYARYTRHSDGAFKDIKMYLGKGVGTLTLNDVGKTDYQYELRLETPDGQTRIVGTDITRAVEHEARMQKIESLKKDVKDAFAVVQENAADAFAEARKHMPDIDLPTEEAMEALSELRKKMPDLPTKDQICEYTPHAIWCPEKSAPKEKQL